MSFKDDFVEALRSVKRDFFRESAGQQESENAPQSRQQFEGESPSEVIPAQSREEPGIESQDFSVFDPPPKTERIPLPPQEEATPDYDEYGRERGESRRYQDPDAPLISGGNGFYGDQPPSGGRHTDFDSGGVYDDSKTIISKNTVIRGALQTDDSVRLLGQVMGDIECRSNIVVAGKVRGNTTAANAYIYDAQVDGDVRCDDVVTVSNDAWVLGNIRAQQAEIDGKVKGNMEIRHMVSIGAQSSILGDIATDELEIKRGAFVNGQIMMYSPSRDVLDRFDRFED